MKQEKYFILLEHHPNDSRLKIVRDDICKTLSSRVGTGGGNVPLIWEFESGDECSNDADEESTCV